MFKSRLYHLLTYNKEQSFADRKNHFYFLGLLGGLKILMEITRHSAWHKAAAQSEADVTSALFSPNMILTQLYR